MSESKTIIISPSGNYYGSEQVLVDFLLSSSKNFIVYIPVNSRLAIEIKSLKLKHEIKYYTIKSLKLFYIKIFLMILLKKVDKIYVNEGGHIKYIKLLAKFFPSAKFFVHIRIIEDTDIKRTGSILPTNIKFITVSNFMMEHLSHIKNKVMIYDPYNFRHNQINFSTDVRSELRIGIVGRIVENKGLKDIISFINYLIETDSYQNYSFHFFGEVFPNNTTEELVSELKNIKNIKITFHGFVSEKQTIYDGIDCLVHFNKFEPLGRIFFESLQYEKPLLGFNSGGIAELAKLNNMQDLLIEYDDENKWHKELLKKLEIVRTDYNKFQQRIREQLPATADLFSVQKYTTALESMIR